MLSWQIASKIVTVVVVVSSRYTSLCERSILLLFDTMQTRKAPKLYAPSSLHGVISSAVKWDSSLSLEFDNLRMVRGQRNLSGVTMTTLGAKCFLPALTAFVTARFPGCTIVSMSVLMFYDTYTFQVDTAAHLKDSKMPDVGYPRRNFTFNHLLPHPSPPSLSRARLATATGDFTKAVQQPRSSLWTRAMSPHAPHAPVGVRRSSEIEAVFTVSVVIQPLGSDGDNAAAATSTATLDLCYLNHHCPVTPSTTFKPTRLSRVILKLTPTEATAAFQHKIEHGCPDIFGGGIPMPVDSSHAYVGACLVTLSEQFEVTLATGGVVGIPDLHYVICHGAHGNHVPQHLSDDEFAATYGFARLSSDAHAYFWRAGPRF